MELDLQSYKESVFGASTAQTAAPAAPVSTETTTEPTVVTPVTETAAPAESIAAPAGAAPAGSPEAAPALQPPPGPVVGRVEDVAPDNSIYDKYIKDKFGLDNEDALRAALAAQKPQTAAEIAFANDESKKIHLLLQEGKIKEVLQYYNAQETISNLDGMNTDQQLKLFIKMQNPLFDNELVEDEFGEAYTIDEEALADDPTKLRKERLKLEQKKTSDLAKAQEFFAQYKTKIELPNTSATPVKDEAYESWKASAAQAEEASKAVADLYAKLTPKQLESKYRFNDEANKLDFTISYEPDAASLANTIELLSDAAKLEAAYKRPDGSLDSVAFARDLYNGRNMDKLAAAMMTQSVTKVQQWFLANQKNVGTGEQKQFTNVVPTEIDNIRKSVFGK